MSHGSDYPSREFLVKASERNLTQGMSGHTFAASASSLSAAAVGAATSRVSAAALHFDMWSKSSKVGWWSRGSSVVLLL